MPKIGFEVTADYAKDLKSAIEHRLSSGSIEKQWRRDYQKALERLDAYFNELGKNGEPVCVDERSFDNLQRVAWNISVTETVGRDISDRIPGAYAWAD